MDQKHNALDAIASMVELDPFGDYEPRECYLRVKQVFAEHEAMRSKLARLWDEMDGIGAVLRPAEEPFEGCDTELAR